MLTLEERERAASPARSAPIERYALIGDTRTTALVGAEGSVDWLCLPNMSDPSLFAAVLDETRGGRLAIDLAGPTTTSRTYVGPTAVLETSLCAPEGTIKITDALVLPPDGGRHALVPARRLVRIIEAVEGSPEVRLLYQPRPGYGRVPGIRARGRLGWTLEGEDFILFQTDLPLAQTDDGTLEGRERLSAGERRTVSLSFSRGEIGVVPGLGDATDACADTIHWWLSFARRIDYRGPYYEPIVRSLVVLRLLNFSQSGAVVAAPTSSLPEAIGGTRNWDYRYCWLRDASFILRAFFSLGLIEEGEAFFRWLMHATQLTAPRLSVLYDVFGRTDVAERTLDDLSGYEGSRPVRVGNSAKDQVQLDVYGSVITAALHYVRHGGRLGAAEQRRLRRLGDVVTNVWREPDNGIWEGRGAPQHHTYSKAMCFAALDALVTMADKGELKCDAPHFAAVREEIRREVLAKAWSPARQAFTSTLGGDTLDAATLLLPRTGIIAPDDPRMVATFERIDAELGRGARIYRYAPGTDGFASREGTFTACGYWAAEYLALRGDTDAARARIDALLADANDLFLMSEETDPDSGRQLGNFPQAFSHAGLVSAVLALRDAETGQKSETPQ